MDNRIVPINIEEEMKKSFISYAMAVIINRALPDVRDGLKPVHRRILYSMSELSLTPDKPFRKSARIVGDVLGKYHPHGDSSVYDAMVRMAQDFSTRYPLVMGHGNFGSVDGDAPAAMRYTEAKLSHLSMEMLRDIDKKTVNFGPNFDESEVQPLVLPARYPNLLVNGTNGIAVGMATNIPPHNLGETVDAFVALVENPEITLDELMAYMPGPDFPTGGIVMGTQGIRDAYRTGRGRIVVRARAEIETDEKDRARIIVSEIPYQVNKARLIERIAELVNDKKIEGISALRDESDRAGMRIVIETKRDANPSVVLNSLYKHTSMQETFGVIMLALVDDEPKVLNLKEVLEHYKAHQRDVVVRRARFDLDKAEARMHIVEGLIKALDNIDEVVKTIRASRTGAEAKERLIALFEFSDKQAQAILDMRLQRLTGLEADKLREEFEELLKTVEYLRRVLSDDALVYSIIKEEILEIKRRYSDPRRTEITQVFDDLDMDELIQEGEMAITLTHFGYIKRLPSDTDHAQRRGGKGISGLATREEDFVEQIFVTSTHNNILFFTNFGRAFRLKCYSIPEAGRGAKGTAIVNLLQLAGGEKVTALIPITKDDAANAENRYLVMATKYGVIKKTELSAFDNIRKGGLIAQNLREGDELIGVLLSGGDDEFMLGTRKGASIRFNENDVRAMGRTATGVRAIKLRGDDSVVDIERVIPGAYVLTVTENGIGKRTPEDAYRIQGRGGLGIKLISLNEKTGDVAGMKMVTGEEDLIAIRDDGTIIRVNADQVSIFSRSASGVKLMRVDDETRLVSVAKAPRNDEDESGEDESEE